MVTAELAACMPVLMLVLAVALSAVSVAGARVRLQDAAREAARALARGDQSAAAALASQAASGAELSSSIRADDAGQQTVTVTAQRTVRLLASWLPAVTITEQATAALEP